MTNGTKPWHRSCCSYKQIDVLPHVVVVNLRLLLFLKYKQLST